MALPSRHRKHATSGSSLPLVKAETFYAIPETATDAEFEAWSHEKKLDPNDLVDALGVEGFRHWMDHEVKAVVTHRKQTSIVSLGALLKAYPKLRDPVIDGLLRRGEILNVVAPPKAGKSMLIGDLVASVISGQRFLDRWQCTRGRVLVADNELHEETIAERYRKIAGAFNITLEDAAVMIDFISMRGKLVDLNQLETELEGAKASHYALIILDAFYKLFPPHIDENSNADMALMYCKLDYYADRLDAAVVVVHHASKGAQGDRAVTDIGSGGGAQSRAADTHLILRPHEEEGVFVCDAVPRSFPPVEAFCARFKYPRWEIDKSADVKAIKGTSARREAQGRAAQVAADNEKADKQLLPSITTPMSASQIREAGVRLNIQHWGDRSCANAIQRWIGAGLLGMVQEQRGRQGTLYRYMPPSGESRPASLPPQAAPAAPAGPGGARSAPEALEGQMDEQNAPGADVEVPESMPREQGASEEQDVPQEEPQDDMTRPWKPLDDGSEGGTAVESADDAVIEAEQEEETGEVM